MNTAEVTESRAWVDQLIEEAQQLVNAPIPVEAVARSAYANTVANVRERLDGAGMSAFVLDAQNGYRLDEINKLLGICDAVSRHLDTSRRPQLSDGARSLPAPGADTRDVAVEL